MHTQKNTNEITPRLAAVAEALGVDGIVLAQFIDEHHNPTTGILLGWAHSRGGISQPTREVRDLVDDYLSNIQGREELEQIDLTDVTDNSRILQSFEGEDT